MRSFKIGCLRPLFGLLVASNGSLQSSQSVLPTLMLTEIVSLTFVWLSMTEFYSDQFTSLPWVDEFKKDLTGKTVVVVGANVGLGLEGKSILFLIVSRRSG